MSELKRLAQETAIYGVSSILGKFLNWCLVPLYSYVLANTGEYGIVTDIYAYIALLIVVLTYGMETGFFRFVAANKDEDRDNRVYSTTLTSLSFTSVLFAIVGVVLCQDIANLMGYGNHPEWIAMMCVTVSLDAFNSIPFSWLRYKNRAVKFASLKLVNIFSNIFFNVFFLVLCPLIAKENVEWIDWFYVADYGVGYVFVSNMLSTLVVTLTLLPSVFVGRMNFDWKLLKKMLGYSLPLLLLGIAGIMNQTVDKILFKMIYPDQTEALEQLGIYGASFKIAMVMMMFTYAFKFAYEPFVFAKYGTKDCKESYADAMKYYVIVALFILLGMVLFKDVFQYLLDPEYRVGLKVIPIVLVTYLIQGIVTNLSLWYKLLDKTYYGTIFSVVGLVVTIVLNVLFVPKYSYWASAGASLVCYIVMMLLSYFIGQKYYKIDYPIKKMLLYSFLTGGLIFVSYILDIENVWLNGGLNVLLLGVFLIVLFKFDLPISEVPILKKIIKK